MLCVICASISRSLLYSHYHQAHTTCVGASIDIVCQMWHNMGIWKGNILMLDVAGIHTVAFCENHERSYNCRAHVHADGMSYL
jgi:hypothetical protein